MEYNKQNKKIHDPKIWQTLILHNCLPLGKGARFTSKNVAQYILGSRNNYDLFKFNEIKHLLLKFTPLIETLFRSKLVLQAKIGNVHKVRIGKPRPPRDPAAFEAWYAKMKNVKITKHQNYKYYSVVDNQRPVQILFASTTPMYRDIIHQAANTCQMSAKTSRWLCGYITANIKTLDETNKMDQKLNKLSGRSRTERQACRTFKDNYERREQRYAWHYSNIVSQRPTLAIIPDIENNMMILRETAAKEIPVIGLVNTDQSTKIAYPIFGNSTSIQIVHFFCHFLSLLIAKTFLQQEYKQGSHRIINRTRAYFTATNKKKLKLTSVDAYTKKAILLHKKVFPISLRHPKSRKKIKRVLIVPKTKTLRDIKQNFIHISKIKLNKKKLTKKLKNNSTQKLKAIHRAKLTINTSKKFKVTKTSKLIKKLYNEKKLRNKIKLGSVGKTPYWKNIKYLIGILNMPRSLKKNQINRFSANPLIRLYYGKQKKTALLKLNLVNATLVKKYQEQLRYLELKQKEIKRSRKLKSKGVKAKARAKAKVIKNNGTSGWIKYKNKLAKSFKKFDRKLKRFNNKFITRDPAIKVKHRMTPNEWAKASIKWKKRNFKYNVNKKKAFKKAFGHKKMIKRMIRFGFSIYPRHKLKFWKKSVFRSKVKPGSFDKLTLWEHYGTKTTKYNNVVKLLRDLKKRLFNIERRKETIGRKLVFQRIWKNKRIWNNFIRKYRYATLLLKDSVIMPENNRKKNPLNIWTSELLKTNRKAYEFNLNKFKKLQIISNNLLWDKSYHNNLIQQTAKKKYKKFSRFFWQKSKNTARGAIRTERETKIYFKKRAVQLQKRKHFHKLINKYRHTKRTVYYKNKKFIMKDMGYYHKRYNKYILKFFNKLSCYPSKNWKIGKKLTKYQLQEKRLRRSRRATGAVSKTPNNTQTKEQMEIHAGIKKSREAEKARKFAKLIKDTEKKEYFEKHALKKAAQKQLKEKKPLSAEQRQKKKEKRKAKKERAKGRKSQDKLSVNDKL